MPHPLLVLDDTQIVRMLRNVTIVSEFPFLQNLAGQLKTQKQGCGGCRHKQRDNTLDYNGVKAAINGLSLDQKRRLKVLLDASKLRFYFVNYKREKVKVTF